MTDPRAPASEGTEPTPFAYGIEHNFGIGCDNWIPVGVFFDKEEAEADAYADDRAANPHALPARVVPLYRRALPVAPAAQPACVHEWLRYDATSRICKACGYLSVAPAGSEERERLARWVEWHAEREERSAATTVQAKIWADADRKRATDWRTIAAIVRGAVSEPLETLETLDTTECPECGADLAIRMTNGEIQRVVASVPSAVSEERIEAAAREIVNVTHSKPYSQERFHEVVRVIARRHFGASTESETR